MTTTEELRRLLEECPGDVWWAHSAPERREPGTWDTYWKSEYVTPDAPVLLGDNSATWSAEVPLGVAALIVALRNAAPALLRVVEAAEATIRGVALPISDEDWLPGECMPVPHSLLRAQRDALAALEGGDGG